MMNTFDAAKEVAQLKAHKKVIRKRVYRRSRLDKFHGELVALRNNGASATDLQRWLKQKNIHVTLTTVTRWLSKRG